MSELEVNIEHIKQQLTKQTKIFGFKISDDMDRIVQLKKDFFGNDFYDCPCHPDDQHFCISEGCLDEIIRNGKCVCGLFINPD